MAKGKLIVLEGIDGSGKSAQYRRLCARFDEMGMAYHHIVFPRYDQESSALIRMYLNGAFGAHRRMSMRMPRPRSLRSIATRLTAPTGARSMKTVA